MQRKASIDLGPYHLVERIGEGGSGQVYRANGPDGVVAIKVLAPAGDLDEAARARFKREITALGQLRHPNLVRLLDHGIDAELGPYLVLPLLAGGNLRALCAGPALCPEAALLLMLPIVQATAALHAAGFVHRDLKPENVIAAPDGTITVIDLGLAWRDGMTRQTDTGTAVGSVGYMAPEQIEGRTVEARADVWALAVMLYELVAGKRPFARARPAEEAAAALLGSCARLSAADRRTDEPLALLVARCLTIDPTSRPSSAELAAAIAAMIDWTDTPDDERAAAVVDPVAYQARVTPFRLRRVERQAREALDAAAPFEALAHCDRGLAYAPDHAGLLALVAAAESATATRRPAMMRAPSEHVAAAPVSTVVTGGRMPSARWLWAVLATIVVAVGVAVAIRVTGNKGTDPWSAPPDGLVAKESPKPTPLIADEGDRKLVGDFVSVLGRAVDRGGQGSGSSVPTEADRALARDMVGLLGEAITHGAPAPSSTDRIPTTADGWLRLAVKQEPTQALASVRHALELDPKSANAHGMLCLELSAAKDPQAVEACDTALAMKPGQAAVLDARGVAKHDRGDLTGALVDFDAAIAADPDPSYRRHRAQTRSAAGDSPGARSDLDVLDASCKAGSAAACK